MKVIIRADASIEIGSGHVMRCVTLAKALKQYGAKCEFICSEKPGNLITWLQVQFTVHVVPESRKQTEDAHYSLKCMDGHYDLLIVDHYQLAENFCQLMRQKAHCIMVIDDLANRSQHCDILLDQNLLPRLTERYIGLVPSNCTLLLGPQYALLRPEFENIKKRPVTVTVNPRRILIFFGGTDADNLTILSVLALEIIQDISFEADIVIGAGNPRRASIEQMCANTPNLKLHVQCDYMAKLMSEADLMLGAGGSTHWERCKCDLPSLIVTVAQNQVPITAHLAELGACMWLGNAYDVTAEKLAQQVRYCFAHPAVLKKMSDAAASIMPADAGTTKVVNAIQQVLRGEH